MTLYARVHDGNFIEFVNYDFPIMDQTILHPNKPRLHEVVDVNADFNPDTQVREGPTIEITPTQYIRTYTVRSKTGAEIEEFRQLVIRRMKGIARDKIGEIMSSDQQFLFVTAGFEGIISHGLDRATWPAALRNVFNPLFNTATTEVKAIYTALRTKIQEVNALTTADQLFAYNVNTGWPA